MLLAGLLSCGYRVKRDEASLAGMAGTNKEGPQRVFVPVVDNITLRTGVEGQMTNALRETLAAMKGLEIVGSEREADFLVIGTINTYTREAGTPIAGTLDSERTGGLVTSQNTAADIRVTLGLEARLLQRLHDGSGGRRLVWSRSFLQSAAYESSRRFTERQGSSSLSHINQSREMMQVKSLANSLAQQIVDQVVQDF